MCIFYIVYFVIIVINEFNIEILNILFNRRIPVTNDLYIHRSNNVTIYNFFVRTEDTLIIYLTFTTIEKRHATHNILHVEYKNS